MIVGISGPLCSGKETMAKFLESHFGFKTINLKKEFQLQYREEFPMAEVSSVLQGTELDDDFYKSRLQMSLPFDLVEHQGIRERMIKRVFKDIQRQWQEKWVIYPISGKEQFEQLM